MAKKTYKAGSLVPIITGANYKVKLKGRVSGDTKTMSLLLEITDGYHYNKNGNPVANVKREKLNMSMYVNPVTPIEKSENKKLFSIADKIRIGREEDFIKKGIGLNPEKDRTMMLDHMQEFCGVRHKKDRHYLAAYVQFKKFLEENNIAPMKVSEVNTAHCKDFRSYLLKNYKRTTAWGYFCCFKSSLKDAVDREVIDRNPCNGISIQAPNEINKPVLTGEEVKKLYNTPFYNGYNNCKRAFLFAVNTGLRSIDIKNLTYGDIDGDYIRFTQQKTDARGDVPLNEHAKALIGKPGAPDEKVFKIELSDSSYNHYIKTWMAAAGINKNITFHCARHTFATLMLGNGIDLKTISNLLGHKSLRMTERYTKLIDGKKESAVEKLGNLF